MSKSTPKTSDDTAKARDNAVEGVKDTAERPRWESPVLTKLPAVEAGSKVNLNADDGIYS
jgi:hypothetical protein